MTTECLSTEKGEEPYELERKKQQKGKTLKQFTFKCKNFFFLNHVISLKYTAVTQSILCLIFLMYIKAIQHLNHGGHESKKQSAIYDSETSVALNQGQSHQTGFELVDPKQGYDNAKFEKTHLLVSVKEPVIKFLSNQETCQLSPFNMHKTKIKKNGALMTGLVHLTILQSFNLIG